MMVLMLFNQTRNLYHEVDKCAIQLFLAFTKGLFIHGNLVHMDDFLYNKLT